MAYNDTLFRTQFPEYANTTTYPSSVLTVFWTIATNFIQQAPDSWNALTGDTLAYATNLMLAHLYNLQQLTAQGKGGGFTTSATVDKVSVTKLAPPAKDAYDWWLAQTIYGQTLSALLSSLLVGGISVGGLPERAAFRKVGGSFW